MSDRLCQLHERLIADHRAPFTSDGDARSVRLTDAGRAWHRDHAAYLREWYRIERQGIEPATILRQRFGYVTEVPPEESDLDDPDEAA